MDGPISVVQSFSAVDVCERIHIMLSQAVYLENMILQNWFFRTATQQEV